MRSAYQRDYRRRLERRKNELEVLRHPITVVASSATSAARVRDTFARQGWKITVGSSPHTACITPTRAQLKDVLRVLSELAESFTEAFQVQYRKRCCVLRPSRAGDR